LVYSVTEACFVDFLFIWPTYWLESILKSPTVIELGSVCACKFSSVYFKKLGAAFGAYMLTIVFSSWGIIPFINMKWPSLSLMTNLVQSLFDMSTNTPACFQGPFAWKLFFHPFTLSQHYLSQWDGFLEGDKWSGLIFLIQLSIPCFLIGEWKLLIFCVIIERYVVLPVILGFFVGLLFQSSFENLLIYEIYSFLYFPGSVYLLLLCIRFL
jgi:hypothetical protein